MLLSSHIMAEVEALCDRVSIIRLGRTVQTGTLAEIRHLTRTSITAHTIRPVSGIAEATGVHDYTADGDRVDFDVETENLDEIMSKLSTFGIRGLVSRPPSLEELFLRQYGDELADLNGGTRHEAAK